MRLLAVLLAGATWLCAQTASQALSPHLLLLSKIRQHMLANLHRQPNYTCLETVERSHRQHAARKFQLLDKLRVEVALVNGKEMFGWPGSKSFEDMDLRKIVSDGAFGNGDFANHARALFEGGSARFNYAGQTNINDRPAVRFDYQVPLLGSGFKLRVENREAVVPYHGAVYADPDTLEIERIEVQADDIPVTLGLARTTDRMDYFRQEIGGGEFLLPGESELSMTDLRGAEDRNLTRFTSCREFSGESVLTFAGAPPPETAPAPAAKIEIPEEVPLMLRLEADVDTRTAAVGDQVRARLENSLKHNGHLLFAQGATAIGHITRLERHDDYTVLGLEFSEMESPGAYAPLHLTLEDISGRELLLAEPRTISVPQARPGEALIPLGAGRFRLPRGIVMFWRTT